MHGSIDVRTTELLAEIARCVPRIHCCYDNLLYRRRCKMLLYIAQLSGKREPVVKLLQRDMLGADSARVELRRYVNSLKSLIFW